MNTKLAHNFLLAFLIFFTLSLPKHINGNTELSVLMEIKSSLDPDNKYLKSWTNEGHPCSNGSFEGVVCNDHLKVANISLQGKGLTGRISPAVAGLKCLSGLYLHYNSLSGEIPKEIFNLTELTDLYLNVNNLSGIIPPQIQNMANVHVLELCCNQLNGNIPREIGYLKKLSVLTLQYNRFTGQIPSTLGNTPLLEVLDVQNNSLSGVVPADLKKLQGGFHYENNPGLCGDGFSSLRDCNSWDDLNINQHDPFAPAANNSSPKQFPLNARFHAHCNENRCTKSSKICQIAFVSGVIVASTTLMVVGFLCFFHYRRKKQKIGNTSDNNVPDDRLNSLEVNDFYSRSASPLVTLEYSNKWDPMVSYQIGSKNSDKFLENFKFNLEEIEIATQYFSEVNLLGKSKFSGVYKGILKDGSIVAIKSINVINCKSEEDEFMNGLRLLTSLRHENLARLRGFCCSMGRGECFLVYDFAPNGKLSRYLDVVDGSSRVLDWSTRISIINGIAKGIGYLHRIERDGPAIVHQNMSVEKILIDQQFNPIIMDSGLVQLLADDIIFLALKASAAMGYMAPEYVTTGRFTEKSDVYAFGVIILQILCGRTNFTKEMRLAAETCRYEDFIDANLKGNFSISDAEKLTKIALVCIDELPHRRPTIKTVIRDLRSLTF